MPTPLLRLGTYDFPPGFSLQDSPHPRTVPAQKLARADGARLLTGTRGEKRFTIVGSLIAPPNPITTVSDLYAAMDALAAALALGPQDFYLRDDRKYTNVQCEDEQYRLEPTWAAIRDVTIPLITGDPYPISVTPGSDTWSVSASGQTHAVTPGGAVAALPKISVTPGGSGGVIVSFVITNTTTGEQFTLSGNATGGTAIVIDPNQTDSSQRVTIAGVDRGDLFRGIFPRLAPAQPNGFSETYSTGTITQIRFDWSDRWNL